MITEWNELTEYEAFWGHYIEQTSDGAIMTYHTHTRTHTCTRAHMDKWSLAMQ